MAKLATDEIDKLARLYSRRKLNEIGKLRLVRAIVQANEKPMAGESHDLPEGYWTLTDLQNSLVKRMWAGFGTAELAAETLIAAGETGKRASGFSPRTARVAAALKRAFLTQKLTLYLVADPAHFNPMPSWAKDPIPVPKELIAYAFINIRGRLPGSFAIRPSRKATGNDQMFAMIARGCILAVRKSESKHWFCSQRKKRRWPSQQRVQCARNPVGRPNKFPAELKAAIQHIVQEGTWHGGRPLTELHCRLVERGLPVSADTIGRSVDTLFAETGNPRLRRILRVRRRHQAPLTAKLGQLDSRINPN